MPRSTPIRKLACLTTLVISLSFTANHAFAAVHYTILDLGTLGASSEATGLNDSGQVVGNYYDASGILPQAFRTAPNTPMDASSNLGTLGGQYSRARAISPSGQVVGWSGTSLQSADYHAFRTAPNGPITPSSDMGTLGGTTSSAWDINASGQLTGASQVGGVSGDHLFKTNPNASLNDAPDMGPGYGYSINSSGQVVGYSTSLTAFRTRIDGSIQTLTPLPGGNGESYAFGINDSGQAVGMSQTYNQAVHAYRTAPNGDITQADDLRTLGGNFSSAIDINNLGQVVGVSNTADNINHAFFVDTTGPMQDLNLLISAKSDWLLTTANAINNNGQIAGTGISPIGQSHAFLLTPALTGDANDDGKVTFADLIVVAQNYGRSDGNATWEGGDFNGDGNVDFADLVLIAQHYDPSSVDTSAGFSPAFQAAWAEVPEPATPMLISLGIVVVMRRKRGTGCKRRPDSLSLNAVGTAAMR